MAANNLVMLSIDDLRSLSDWGHFTPLVETPNIERLMTMGTTFERAITQVPLCNPSRSSVFSGQQPSQTGVLDNAALVRAHRSGGNAAGGAQGGRGLCRDVRQELPIRPIDAPPQAIMFDEFMYRSVRRRPPKVKRDGSITRRHSSRAVYTGPITDLRDEHTAAAAIDFLETAPAISTSHFSSASESPSRISNWWVPLELLRPVRQ